MVAKNTMNNFYTGIGSRTTPVPMQRSFTALARQLERDGWMLRSGGADGADSAFEAGIELDAKEIYLPWAGFNGKSGIIPDRFAWSEAERIASNVHPAWAYLKPAVRKLHARNVFEVLGADLATPSAFVLCWTADGAETEAQRTAKTGGTGMAIALASRHGIPVLNFANADAAERLAAARAGLLNAAAPMERATASLF